MRFLQRVDAPPALGRSGARVERGMKTSGLLGEQFYDGQDLGRNNFVQRAWLPTPDPSLEFRRSGVPHADYPEGMSLPIGGETSNFNPDDFHGRTAGVTGDLVLKKKGPSVFVDEAYFKIRKYPAPYPDTMLGYSDENGRIETPYEPRDKSKKHFYRSSNTLGTAGTRTLSSAGIPPASAPDMDHTMGYIKFSQMDNTGGTVQFSHDNYYDE